MNARILLLIALLPCAAQAKETAEIVRPEDKGKRIPWLEIETTVTAVEVKTIDGAPVAIVPFKGHLTKQLLSLSVDDELLIGGESDQRNFETELQLSDRITDFDIVIVDERGETKLERIFVLFENWENVSKEEKLSQSARKKKRSTGRLRLIPSFGLTTVSYTETYASDVLLVTETVKISADYALMPKRLDVGANFFVNLFPLSTTGSTKTIRFMGANIRAGYHIPWITSPWSIIVFGGLAYSHMLVQDRSLGYSNLINLQLFPVVARKFESGLVLSGFIKFVPFKGIFDQSQRELAIGVGAQFTVKQSHRITVNLDLSDLKVKPSVIQHHAFSVTLGAGYVIEM